MHFPYYVQLNNHCLIKVAGKDASTFLQGQLTCDLKQISHQQSSLGACCDRKGRVLFSFRIFLQGDDYYLHLPKSLAESALEHLRKYVIIAKVTLSLEENLCLGLGGNEIEKWLRTHFAKIPTSFGEVYQHENTCLICVDSHKARFLLINHFPRVNGLKELDVDAWQLADIQQEIVTIYPETQGQFIPQMLNYEKLGAVSFTKGCYVGQEIIARTQHLGKLKRHLHRLTADKAVAIGEEIFNAEAESVGVVAASALNEEKKYSLLAVLHDQSTASSFYLQDKSVLTLSEL